MTSLLRVADSPLSSAETESLLRNASLLRRVNRFEYRWLSFESPQPGELEQILRRLSFQHNDLTRCAGIEYWIVELAAGQDIGWHIDKDESKFVGSSGREVVTPLASLVCYLDCEQLVGGLLEIDSIGSLEPAVGRCIIFDGKLRHRVTEVQAGRRVSLILNLWEAIPRAYTDEFRKAN